MFPASDSRPSETPTTAPAKECVMDVMARSRIEVVPLTRHIGAEIRGFDLRDKPDEETLRAIHRAWLDHLVIIFPGQNLSQEDLARVTAM